MFIIRVAGIDSVIKQKGLGNHCLTHEDEELKRAHIQKFYTSCCLKMLETVLNWGIKSCL